MLQCEKIEVAEITSILIEQYREIRSQTLKLVEGLSPEDLLAQSMPDASPGKWHLAHTTWFFETFILARLCKHYQVFHEDYNFLFNSYYDNVGQRHARPQRGLLTRPSLSEVFEYRAYVDQHMEELLQKSALSTAVHCVAVHQCSDSGHASERETTSLSSLVSLESLVTIGLHHEMQHQELLLTDLLHLFSCNPLAPAVKPGVESAHQKQAQDIALPLSFKSFDGGVVCVGSEAHSGDWRDFAYDCEQPRHRVYLSPFAFSTRLVTNREWLAFIEDGGYRNSLLWLSDGWACVQKHAWQAPLYWQKTDGEWSQFTLSGRQTLNLDAPVTHISFFEAHAFAQWYGKRLPREHEWEYVASKQACAGNFVEQQHYQPQPLSQEHEALTVAQLYGDVWEWTQSAFAAYPGFKPKQGALGEYNGKFMNGQYVLRGGSCVTPATQVRASYRNFFYPHQRWQFSGVRLADDI